MFEAEFSPQASKFLKKCDKLLAMRIIEKIEKLRSEAFPSEVVRVVNRAEKIFRVRVGDCRIQYSVFYEKNIIFISDIDKRPRAY